MDVAVTDCAGGVVLVTLRGALDIDSAPQLREAMHGALDRGRFNIVVDLGDVDFCDSVGLGTFAYSHNRCVAEGGHLRLAAPTPFLARLLDTVGLTGRIPVYETVSDALTVDPAAGQPSSPASSRSERRSGDAEATPSSGPAG